MQRQDFAGGGFVLHRVKGPFKGHASAWFDVDGALTAAELFAGGFGSAARPVREGGPVWRHLQRTGRAEARLGSADRDGGGVPGYSNYGGGGAFAPLASPRGRR